MGVSEDRDARVGVLMIREPYYLGVPDFHKPPESAILDGIEEP